jgi:hypothetical protein
VELASWFEIGGQGEEMQERIEFGGGIRGIDIIGWKKELILLRM